MNQFRNGDKLYTVADIEKLEQRNAELEKENKRESMELRSRLGAALGRNSEYNSAIENMQRQLVKANERVVELEQENKEFTMLIASLVRRADVKTDLMQNPTFEKASEQLNKFAIEKKIDLLSKMVSSASDYMFNHDKLDIRANHLDMLLKNFCNYHREQLRKEQDDV